MKKIILSLALVFATGTMINASSSNNNFKELNPSDWTCEEWSDFVFEWVGIDHTFEEAAEAAETAFNNCINNEIITGE